MIPKKNIKINDNRAGEWCKACHRFGKKRSTTFTLGDPKRGISYIVIATLVELKVQFVIAFFWSNLTFYYIVIVHIRSSIDAMIQF